MTTSAREEKTETRLSPRRWHDLLGIHQAHQVGGILDHCRPLRCTNGKGASLSKKVAQCEPRKIPRACSEIKIYKVREAREGEKGRAGYDRQEPSQARGQQGAQSPFAPQMGGEEPRSRQGQEGEAPSRETPTAITGDQHRNRGGVLRNARSTRFLPSHPVSRRPHRAAGKRRPSLPHESASPPRHHQQGKIRSRIVPMGIRKFCGLSADFPFPRSPHKAAKCLIYMVAGAGFEPTTFRL